MVSLEGKIFLSFDVEEARNPDGSLVPERLDCSADGVNSILDFLEELQIPATFFATGFFSAKKPQAIKRIVKAGHEVASHGYRHVRLAGLGREEINGEIASSVKALAKATGKKPKGFRAPFFSVNNAVLDAVEAQGFKYDSSLDKSIAMAFRNHGANFKRPKLREFQISHFPVLRLPMSWHWARRLGPAYVSTAIKLNLRLYGQAILFFHSWEFADSGKKFAWQLKGTLKKFDKSLFFRMGDCLEGFA
ncbi:MAG: polysaccharide deacetylase family protein [Candidatus Diapherotrites archaeon]